MTADRRQAGYVAALRAESCTDPRVPLQAAFPARPDSGPSVAAYYATKHAALPPGAACGRHCPTHRFQVPQWKAVLVDGR